MKHLIFVKDIPEWDVDAHTWSAYKYLIGKARFMERSAGEEGWATISGRKSLALYVDDTECIDLTDYTQTPGKVTLSEKNSLAMLYPEYDWDNAFLKKNREGW